MRKITLLLLILSTLSFQAQQFKSELLQDLKPRNIGPGGMSGRVTSIDVVHTNPDILYAGTASGGLWKSESGGVNWNPIFDEEVTASIGAVAIQQSNPSVIWAGTGEGNPRNSLNGGFGIYKSLDAGKSWKLMGLEKTRHIHRIVIDPTNPNKVYVGAIGSPWGAHPERGVFQTSDGGETWTKILYSNELSGVADLVMDPSNPNKLLAALWEHKRDPWFFKSGGSGSGLYITYDGGENWKKLGEKEGLPKGELGRIGIAIASNRPSIIYALVEAKKNALYRSEDGGFNWKKVNDKTNIGNRPFYYSDIFVDPENENRIYSIFTYVNVSEDGGKSFKQLMPAYQVNNGVHPDHHAWWIHPENGQFMIDGNDGGLNITKDGGSNWRFIGNLPVAQFYHISVDMEYPYNVYGGMQDNGSWRGPAYVWREQGIRNSYWQEITFGDGFDVIPDPDDSRFGYSMSQQGFVSRYDWQTRNNYLVRPTPPDDSTLLRFNWNAGIGQDPFDNSTIYFGSQFVHKSKDKGLTWDIISPDLTTNDIAKQKQDESGGLTLDATGAENYCTILVIEPSKVEKDMLWVGTDDGRIHSTIDGGQNWTDLTDNIKGLPSGSWIAQIKASDKNKGEALLIANDYRRFNYTPYAFRTKDYGKTWRRIVDQNDVKSYTLSIVEDPISENLLFLGTDDGLYYSLDAAEKWQKWNEGFPTVSTKDLVIHPREQDLVIGTFGRAAWVLDDIRPLRELASDKTILEEELKIFSPPDAYLAAYQQPTGSRFGGDAMYNAENRKKGAMITYYLKSGYKPKVTAKKETESDEETSDDSKEKKKDSLKLRIYEGESLIRTLKFKTPEKAGFHRIYWELDQKGAQKPSRTISKDKKEASGMPVRPGTYRLELTYADHKDTTEIRVKQDPRIKVDDTAFKAIYSAQDELIQYTEVAANAVKQLVESKNTTQELRKKLKSLDKEKYAEIIKSSNRMVKSIDSLIALYLGKKDKRQGIIRNKDMTVMKRIRNAETYVNTRRNGFNSTEKQLMDYAKKDLASAIDQTNEFYSSQWVDYKDSVNALDLSPFKEVKTFELD
ncbi:MAG: WD40/YVTN/BNR-like repeat-containing protein [Flavobacteriaceae bacterium]